MLTTQSIAALRSWLSSITRRQLRLVESLQSVTLVTGRRLRGVRLAEGLYLGRDRQLYMAPDPDRTVATRITDELVIQLYHVGLIRRAYADALTVARGRRHGSCPSTP